MKIYSVSKGEYSDYKVMALYSNKEYAEGICNRIRRYYKYDRPFVEEFTLDENLEILKKGYNIYFLRMDREGNASGIEITGDIDNIGDWGFDIHNKLYMYVLAKDEKHAIKIVNDKRAELIANNEWEVTRK